MRLAIFTVAVLLSALPTPAATLRVPSQYPTINAALDLATSGDSVLVAPGTYADFDTRVWDLGGGPTTATAMAFMRDGVSLLSQSGADGTTLDMRGAPQNSYAIAVTLLPSGPTVIDGFTIVGADPTSTTGIFFNLSSGVTVKNCKVRDMRGGGGIRGASSNSVEILDTELDNCVDATGGGMGWSGVSGVIHRCVFRNCQSAVQLGGFASVPTNTAEIVECEFLDNYNGRMPAGSESGGALRLVQSAYKSLLVEDCVFKDNGAYAVGGAAAFFVDVGATVTLRGNTFLRCTATGSGGGVLIQGGGCFVEANTFSGCAVPAGAGGAAASLYLLATLAQLNGNVIEGSAGASAVEHLGGGYAMTSCNVFWNNADGDVTGFQLSASDRIVDPLFCYPAADDLTVAQNSPCLPVNSNGCGQIGAWGEGCRPVSVTPSSWASIKARYR